MKLPGYYWWSHGESNPRSEPCKGPVLPLNYGPVTDMTTTVSPLVIPTSNSLSYK
jgi:hypothetical protein